MSQATTIKKGQHVKYKARATAGTGKVVAIRQSGRGNWYDIKTTEGRAVSLRLSQLTAI